MNESQRQSDHNPEGVNQSEFIHESRRNKYQENLKEIVGEKPLGLEQLQAAAEKIENSVPQFDPFSCVTADKDYIYFPGRPPKERKQTNRWRDANDEEMHQHQKQTKLVDFSDNSFFDDFMAKADKDLMKNLNPTILNALQDPSKIKKKIYIPKNPGVNYIGLLIGPQGHYQKRLEEESDCKILIRGKGS